MMTIWLRTIDGTDRLIKVGADIAEEALALHRADPETEFVELL